MNERRFQRISATDALTRLAAAAGGEQPYALFDCRDAHSYAQAHLPDAQPLNEAGFAELMVCLSKQRPVMIYCYHGNASQVYAQMFADFGWHEVYSVDGGFEALQRLRTPPSGTALPVELSAWLTAHGYPADAPEALGPNLTTPLMHAARQGERVIIEALLAQGVALDARNADGNNALWLACFHGDPAVVRRLAEAGVPIDNQNDNGATCLMYTASAGKHELVAVLLELGADPALRNLDDFSALDFASTVEGLRLLRQANRPS